ncbi:hypothetical protein, partial [Mycolicibacterium mageritense]|uniref:hypothetical protein n=1 Tax=Mycolicibacterium mageritense TaxID=53462 RepID=UPI0011DA6AC0
MTAQNSVTWWHQAGSEGWGFGVVGEPLLVLALGFGELFVELVAEPAFGGDALGGVLVTGLAASG